VVIHGNLSCLNLVVNGNLKVTGTTTLNNLQVNGWTNIKSFQPTDNSIDQDVIDVDALFNQLMTGFNF
jgi:hypothetical protein